MTAPPDIDTEEHHDEEIQVSNFGWWALGGALGTAITVGAAFVVLMGLTGKPDYVAGPPGAEPAGNEVAVSGDALAAVTLVATEFAFAPDAFVAETSVTVTLDNQGAVIHNFVVEGIAEDVFAVVAEAGQVTSGTVDLTPGDYVFFCSIPGHRAAGMEGRMTVAAG